MKTDSGIRKRQLWMFCAVVTLALLPLMIFRDFTSDNELRYLSIVDEALRNHDFFAFHNHGLAYADKPPLYFWLLMLCRWLAGAHYMWLLSLCSLLPAYGVIAVMEKWAGTLFSSSQDCNVSRSMLMTSAYFLGAAVILRMDMLMCLFIVLAFRTFWKMYERRAAARDCWLFPIWLFLALFTKGPLGILIPLVSTFLFLLLKRDLRSIGRYWGWRTWGVLSVACILWFVGVYFDGGKDYLDNLLFHQTIDRAVDAFHHKRPVYYYLIAIWYVMAPWSIYAIGAMVADLRSPSRLPALQQLYIAIALTTLVMLSCISSKLQIYMLPAIPFFIYSAMVSMPKYKDSILTKLAVGFPAAVFAVTFIGYIFVLLTIGLKIRIIEVLAIAILSVGGIGSCVLLWKKGVYDSIKCTSGTILAAIFMIGWAIPDYNAYIGYGEVCAKAKEISQQRNIDNISVLGLKRPENMDVYLGRKVTILEGDSMPKSNSIGRSVVIVRSQNLQAPTNVAATVGPYAIIVNE